MFVSLDSTMLEYYEEELGLPYVAVGLTGMMIGFIFPQAGGYEVDGLRRVESIEEMLSISKS
jgi:hypothetical protein